MRAQMMMNRAMAFRDGEDFTDMETGDAINGLLRMGVVWSTLIFGINAVEECLKR